MDIKLDQIMEALSNTGVPTFLFFPGKNTLLFSSIAASMLGCNELYENSADFFVNSLIHPDDCGAFSEMLHKMEKGETSAKTFFRKKDGFWQGLATMSTVKRGDSNEPIEVLGVLEERTEKAEDKAVVSFDKHRSGILAVADMGMWSLILGDGTPRFFMDDVTAYLLGVEENPTPEEAYAFWKTRVTDKCREDVKKCLDNILAGIPDEVTYPYDHPSLGTITIRCGGVLDADYEGSGSRIIGYHQNISRYAKEVSKAKQLSLLNSMFNQMTERFPMGIFAYTLPDHRILLINEETVRLFGFSGMATGDFKGIFVMNNVHPEDRLQVREQTSKLKETGDSVEYFFRTVSEDSKPIYVHCSTKLCAFSDGTKYILSAMNDITGNHLVTERLIAEKAKYREVLDNNVYYSFSADLTDGKITDNTETADARYTLSSLGFPAPADYDSVNRTFIEKNQVEILTPEGESFFTTEGLRKLFAEGKRHESVEYYSKVTDEYIRVMPLLSEDPVSGHIIATILAYNITETKTAELEQQRILRDALEKAEQANRSKTVFLNNMSHDIRTPLNAITGFLTLASMKIKDATVVSDCLDRIKKAAEQLLGLINDVLDMSRIESGKVNLKEQTVNLSSAIDDISGFVQWDVHKKNQIFTVEKTNLVNEFVKSDRLRINQILTNCIGNAIKYTPEYGKITVKLEQRPCEKENFGTYVFKICDNGIGMDPDFVKRIFEPFEREKTSTVSGIEGTGLGMSITKKVVEIMGGTITVESEVNRGSVFTITLELPFAETDEKTVSLSESRKSSSEIEVDSSVLAGIRVLVVEDNPLNRDIAVRILKAFGAEVQTAEDGSAALEKISGSYPGEFNVVLMDVQMPVLNGYEATKKIRSMSERRPDFAALPIIAMTANVFEDDARMCLEAGMNAHLGKPLDVKNVVRTVSDFGRRKWH